MGNLIVANAEFRCAIQHWVNMQGGSGRFSGEDPEGLDELFLQLVGEVILSAEDNHTPLGDCSGQLVTVVMTVGGPRKQLQRLGKEG